jgi:hypothetical protein
MNRLRHTEELVGFLVLAAILVLLGAMLQAGLLGRWFQPTSTLRIVLPGTGGGGLARMPERSGASSSIRAKGCTPRPRSTTRSATSSRATAPR